MTRFPVKMQETGRFSRHSSSIAHLFRRGAKRFNNGYAKSHSGLMESKIIRDRLKGFICAARPLVRLSSH
jgi:hypothetical protein